MTVPDTRVEASPSAALPSETTTIVYRELGGILDRVLTGQHIAIERSRRRSAVLVDPAWYDRQPGSSPNLVSTRTPAGNPISRADYVEMVGNRAATKETAPIQLDYVEAMSVAELLDELAAAYTHGDPVGRLARQCAEIIYKRLGL